MSLRHVRQCHGRHLRIVVVRRRTSATHSSRRAAGPGEAAAGQAGARIPPPAPRQGKDINIRIDATVIESRGDHVVDKKVISVTCVDGKGAFVRSTQSVAFKAKGSEGFNYQDAPLNMDADVNLRDDGRVLARITVDYRGMPASQDSPDGSTGGIRQSVSVILKPGEPLMVAQSADAVAIGACRWK